MYKYGLKKGRTRNQIANIFWITEKAREFQKNIYFCFIDYIKAFDYVDHNKLWDILKEIGIPDHLTYFLRNLYVSQEATLETYMEQLTGLKLGKEYNKAVYCHPVYLTSMQSTSCEMPDRMNYKLESIAWRNINNLRYADDTTLTTESEEELKSLLLKVKEKSEKAWLKTQHSEIMASSPITSGQIEGEKVSAVTDFIFLGSTTTLTVTIAMKLKDTCFLEEKLRPT